MNNPAQLVKATLLARGGHGLILRRNSARGPTIPGIVVASQSTRAGRRRQHVRSRPELRISCRRTHLSGWAPRMDGGVADGLLV